MAERKRKHSSVRSTPSMRTAISLLPDTPGVYLMYGLHGELLYVGKSKTIRSRVRAHFAARDEAKMCRQVCHIAVRETAGELGALLLESQLIKELKPLYNIRSRQLRRIIVARRLTTPKGYTAAVLDAISQLDPTHTGDLLGIFRTKTQAREFLAHVARNHRLCPKLLGLERTARFCFAYHLHQCDGACMGLEPAASYNQRVEQAFEERRIKAWPFEGAVIIEEKSGERGEVFVVDNWCLLYSFTYALSFPSLNVRGLHRFDYDSYKILAGYVFTETHAHSIRLATKEEVELLLKRARAA